MKRLLTLGMSALALATPAMAQDLIPERRFVVTQDQDLPGGDVASVFDTTIEACERACLTNPACTAFTFNTRNGSCFPKSQPGEGTDMSAELIAALSDPMVRELANRGSVRSFPKNTVIINEGDRGESLFVILSGKVKVVAFDATECDRILSSDTAALDDAPAGRFQRGINVLGSGLGFVHGCLRE